MVFSMKVCFDVLESLSYTMKFACVSSSLSVRNRLPNHAHYGDESFTSVSIGPEDFCNKRERRVGIAEYCRFWFDLLSFGRDDKRTKQVAFTLKRKKRCTYYFTFSHKCPTFFSTFFAEQHVDEKSYEN